MLTNCPECGWEVSNVAPSCQCCGYLRNTDAAGLVRSLDPDVRVDWRGPPTPIYLIAAGMAFIVALCTPRIVVVLPILGAVILAIMSLVRHEPSKVSAVGIIVLSIGLFLLSALGFPPH